ncbi:2-pyrone-4,6-dicarboxylate hydrolase [Roseomonas nepalensis]|uniref:2-pyrone-4,6-dicarboxylate hydrolase n=1 Tax=Muricoccus nepalensis TaxID=1854500 RepID=A0A502EVE8_9PROT|nr:amidohydrolase family protein [Roseomonas nepalensis]TPG41895.1 2-pyrone-4,6-dicarboxylate hydrolase [Roseomonas nepalensis]
MATPEAALAPWSAGSEPPATPVPPGATDCHFHIYDSQVPSRPGTPHHPDALEEDYLALRRRLGVSRGVLVQPSAYGTDNARHLPAMEVLGPKQYRMVAVVEPDIPEAALRRLDAAGVRGVRFNLVMPGVLTAEVVEPLGRRLATLGWHVQLNASEAQLVALEPALTRLPCRLVLDHLGQVPHPTGLGSAAFGVVRRLLDRGSTWVKISGPYIRSRAGPPTYEDAGRVTSALAQAAPERLLWGSDWPHPTQTPDRKPNDADLLDLGAAWVAFPPVWHRILVDNPMELYGFSGSRR